MTMIPLWLVGLLVALWLVSCFLVYALGYGNGREDERKARLGQLIDDPWRDAQARRTGRDA